MTPRRLRANSGSGEIFDSNGDMQDRYGYKIPETLLPQYTDWLEATKDENKRRSESEANAPILYSLSQPYFDFHAEQLFRDGVPPSLRRSLYLQVTGVGNTIARNRGRYDSILAARGDDQEESNSAREQISRDIKRTFTGNARLSNDNALAKLSNILKVYARYNRQVGYSQSMSFIVLGLLLLEFSEEEAFWMLEYMLSLMPDCYDKELSGMKADVEMIEYYVRAKLPRLHAYFLRNFVDANFYAFPMLMCFYVGYLPYETLFRLWDRIMYKGAIELFRSCLKFLFHMQEKLIALGTRDIDEIMPAIIEAHLNLFDADAALGKMPGNQRMESGQITLRRMRIRERNRLSHMSVNTNAVFSMNPLGRSSPTLSRNSPSGLRKSVSLKSATATAVAAAAAATAARNGKANADLMSKSDSEEGDDDSEDASSPPPSYTPIAAPIEHGRRSAPAQRSATRAKESMHIDEKI